MVANSINSGVWGYDNLNWLGGTYYHKFNDYWHFAFETWNIHEFKVPNPGNPGFHHDADFNVGDRRLT